MLTSSNTVTTVQNPAVPSLWLGLFPRLQVRFRLVIISLALVVLVLLVIVQTLSTYDLAYHLFQNIVEDNSVKVDAAELALQHVAASNTLAADYIGARNSDTKNTTLTRLTDEFRQFRDQMYILRTGLHTTDSTAAYDTTEKVVYEQFWPQISLVTNLPNVPDKLQAYLTADHLLVTQINDQLQQMEKANFDTMVTAEKNAGSAILGQTLFLIVATGALAVGLVVLSFWLRRKIRRYLTPGLDSAAILSIVFLLISVGQLWSLPEQLRAMVEDAYYSVTASSRVIALANQINRTESAELIDPDHARQWQQEFDKDSTSLELRLCGQPNCMANTFLSVPDVVSPIAYKQAKAIAPANSNGIGGIVPLVANITYVGEADSLEKARKAFNDYHLIDGQTRQLLAQGNLEAAYTLNTGTKPGQSNEAFNRFSEAMLHERAINRQYFDDIWHAQQSALTTNRIVLLVGYAALILLLAAGTYHRYREL